MSVAVPTADEFGALSARTAALEARERPAHEVHVAEGRNDAAIADAVSEAMALRNGSRAGAHVVLPPGDFHLKKPLLDHRGSMLEGFGFRGLSRRATRVFHDAAPANADDPWANNLITAHGLRFLSLSDITFVSASPKNSFAYLWGTWDSAFNNRWTMRGVEWQGSWNRVWGLDGNDKANLNSELLFDDCETAPSSTLADAFFRTGVTGQHNQMNQFVNYRFRDCNLSLTSGTVFKLVRGGSVYVDGGSWSAADKAAGPICWFSMPERNLNNRGATRLSVRGVRFEPKSSKHLIIDCRWCSGSVTFEDCVDLCSAQEPDSPYNAGWSLHRYSGADPWGKGGTMPTVRYRSHQGIGHHSYSGPAVKFGSITYDGCYWWRGPGGQTAPKADVLRWNEGAPRRTFDYCDNLS